nr:MAG TPA: hypothetical protein [Caudoviricetes sp.]
MKFKVRCDIINKSEFMYRHFGRKWRLAHGH